MLDLPDDLIIQIINNINNTDDIFNLRLTNKLFYKILKKIPIYKNNKKIYEITLKDNIINWYNLLTKENDKEIIFKPYGGIEIKNNNIDNNNDYKFNLPYSFYKIKKDHSFKRKHIYDIKNNKYTTEVMPIRFPIRLHGCNIF